MSRARVGLATVLLLLVAAFLWWSARHDSTGEQASDDAVRPAPSAGAAPDAPPVQLGSSPRAASGDAAAQEREAPATAPPPSTAGWHAVGVVQGPDGTPVPDAEIRLMLYLREERRPVPDARTDAQGRYVAPIAALDAMSADDRAITSVVTWAVAPKRKTFGPRWAPVSEAEATREIRFDAVLAPGASVRGRIVDAAARPVAGADATLCALERKQWVTGGTDAAGRFAVPIPRDGRWSLHGTRTGVGAAVFGEISLDDARDEEVGDLVLRGDGWIEGRCVYPDGSVAAYLQVGSAPAKGEPQPPTETCWTENLGLLQGHARADEKGRFRIAGLKPGRYVVEPSSAPGHSEAERPPTIASTGDRDVVVTCHTRRLFVRAVDEAGRPAPQWDLVASGVGEHVTSSYRGSYSGASSSEAFETEPGMTWQFEATTPSARSGPVKLVTGVEPWETSVTLVLRAATQPRGRIRVTVAGPDGKPVAPFRAEAVTVTEGTGVFESFEFGPETDGLSPPLEPGRYDVSVSPGAVPSLYLSEQVQVTVQDGETPLFAVKARLGGRLQVTFRERGAVIPSNAWLTLTRTDRSEETTLSPWSFVLPDEAKVGVAHFVPDVALPTVAALEPGRWTLRLAAQGVRPFETVVDVQAGRTEEVEVLVEPE
jgi:hypothetical protein